MTEYEKPQILPKISTDDGGATVYRCELDLSGVAAHYAHRIASELDAEVLRVLEKRYGFVNPVRCRDCEQGIETERNGKAIIDCHGPLVQTWDHYNDEPLVNPVPPDGFCKWGIRRKEEA